ncbi:MAG: sugar ABC transporter permease [Firmicutes bacterium]|nr:sugar ABC transporter permease [Bacillota bacterium]
MMQRTQKYRIKYSKREKRGAVVALCLLAFPVFQFLIFYAYINFSSVALAFQDRTGAFTFDNFRKVYENFFKLTGGASLFTPLKRSLITWSFGMLFLYPFSILTTYALFKKVPGERLFRVVFFLPSLLGVIVMTTLFKKLLAANGPVFELIRLFGIKMDPRVNITGLLGNPKTAFATIIFYGFWSGIGGNIIILTGALSRVPKDIFESARLDGASFMTEFLKISLPLIWPTISMMLIFSMSGIFIADSGTFLLVGATSSFMEVSTMGYEIFMIMYNMAISGNQSALVFGYPAALGFTITAVTIPIVLTVRFLIEKFTDDISY